MWNKRVKRLQSQWLKSDNRNEEAMVEQDAGRCSWLALEKHAAHAAKGGTHLLRSPGRSLLQSPLENLAQILDTEARISAGGQRGDREQHRPRQNQSKHQPTTTSTGHMYIYNRDNQQRAWNMKKRERERERLKSEIYKHFRLPFGQNSLWFGKSWLIVIRINDRMKPFYKTPFIKRTKTKQIPWHIISRNII